METKSLLIIEDDLMFANSLTTSMKRHGFVPSHAPNASEALAFCQEIRPQYILLDLKLASESGLQLIKPLRALVPEARIILLTGYASIATAVNAIQLGANDYLPKPVDMATLLNALNVEADTTPEVEVETAPMSPERLEWEHLHQVLQQQQGNISATARVLGMHRRTLQRKLDKHPVAR